MVQFSHSYMITGKTVSLTIWTFVSKVMSLLFNMLSSFGIPIAFLPRNKCLLISWLQSMNTGILESKIIVCHCFSPSLCHEMMEKDAMNLIFWMLNFKPAFSLFSFTFIKMLFNSYLLSAIRLFITCISEVFDSSTKNLDSSFRFIQPSILYDVLCI